MTLPTTVQLQADVAAARADLDRAIGDLRAGTSPQAMGQRAGFGRTVLGALAIAVDEALILVLPSTGSGVDLELVATHRALSVTIAARSPQSPLDPAATARFGEVVGDLIANVDADASTASVRLEVALP